MSESGVAAVPGPPGPAGATGAAGVTVPGADGDDGRDGDPGLPGPTGATGAAGATGAVGPMGPMGPPGLDGADGHDGLDGRPGIIDVLPNGQLLVGQPGNYPLAKAITGDIGISATGAVTVAGWEQQSISLIAGAGKDSIPVNVDGTQWTFNVADSGGNSWTPTLTQPGAIAKTINNATYIQLGGLVMGWCRLTPTAAGTAGSAVIVGTPVTAKTSALVVGAGNMTLAGVRYNMTVRLNSTTAFTFRRDDAPNTAAMGIDPNAALANAGDEIDFFFILEAA